jgi:peptidyl-tRNA hydrolase, PTH2 family
MGNFGMIEPASPPPPPHPVEDPKSLEISDQSGKGEDNSILPGDVKQVIVIRRDLNMRRGKEIAQGAHASSAWLAFAVAEAVDPMTGRATVEVDEVARVWITTSFRKVTLQVRSEQELIGLHEKALGLGLRSQLIRDSGRTEFGGIPTFTALAIGPNLAERIDEVTGELSIY